MKTLFKRILWGVAIVIALIIIFVVGFFLKMKSEVKDMNVTETKEIIANIYTIKDSFVNLYLVKDSNNYVAFDAGNDVNVVSAQLNKLAINPDNVVAVLLTHTDRDHVAALSIFKNAKVYFAKEEMQMLRGEKHKFIFMTNKISTKEYTLLDDQQTITIGNVKVKGYLMPGHTSGSMCYLVNDKYLFTGDALSLKNGKIAPMNKFFNMDNDLSIKSIANITKIDSVAYIFTAHHGFTNDYKSAVKDWGK
ncbi:MAG: MBL fold metallo-hydrolase [Bacteroidota bacterium]